MSRNLENLPPNQPLTRPTTSSQNYGTTNPTRPRLERSKLDQPALNFGSQSARTTMDPSSFSHFHASQSSTAQDENANANAGDRDSVYTYRSDLDASRFLRQVSGRVYNTINDAWFFPSDENEWSRLNKQHLATILALGGLYPVPDVVNAILAPQAGVRKKILDIGTGTGIWAVDMAKKFPHVEVTGVDIAPVPIDSESRPPNCQFEIDDVGLGLSHFWNQFDLVHGRFFGPGLKNCIKTMKDIHKCLKPGGLMIWLEPDYVLLTPDIYVHRTMASEANPSGSWTSRLIYEITCAATKVGGSDFAGMKQALDEGLWDEPLFDPDTCRTASLYLPVGTWVNHSDSSISQRLKFIGALTRLNIIEGMEGCRVVLVKAGWQPDTIAEWIRLAREEMASTKKPSQVRYKLAWGRRRASPGQSAPPLSSLASPPTTNATGTQEAANDTSGTQDTAEGPFPFDAPFPFFYVCHTREEALAEAARRNRGKEGFVPPLLPP